MVALYVATGCFLTTLAIPTEAVDARPLLSSVIHTRADQSHLGQCFSIDTQLHSATKLPNSTK